MDKLNELKTYIGKCEESGFDAGIKTCLQRGSGISSHYVVYRWVQFVMHSVILVGAMLELYAGTLKIHGALFYAKWLLYLTSWVLILNMTQALIGAVILTMAYMGRGSGPVYGLSRKLVDVYCAMYSVALNFAVFMAFGYWELRIGLPKGLTLGKTTVLGCYGFSVFLMLTDLFVVQFPYRMKTGLYAFAAMMAYLFSTWLHFHTRSLDAYQKTRYIYPGLDWSKPAIAVEHSAVCVFMLLVLNCSSLWGLCQLRRYILNRDAHSTIEPRSVHEHNHRHHHERSSFESSHDHPSQIEAGPQKKKRKSL